MASAHPTPFGRLQDGREVQRYVLRSDVLEVGVLTYGATLHSVLAPDREGSTADVLLGHDDVQGYETGEGYLGATVGRFANRIAAGRFELDGQQHQVPVNDGPNSLHGGPEGFHQQLWSARVLEDVPVPAVELRHTSPDGAMGFPGTLEVTVTYALDGADLSMTYRAVTDAPTVVNLTNHAYWNLSGGLRSTEQHSLLLAASRYLPVDDVAIPTGELAPVAGTPMDFRSEHLVGERLRDGTEQLLRQQGYDHCWVLDREDGQPPTLAARLADPASGRRLEVWTDQPGVQFYSGNFLDGSARGKGGRALRQGDGVCLETQHLPDSPNRPHFPSTVLRPGEELRSTTVLRTGADAG